MSKLLLRDLKDIESLEKTPLSEFVPFKNTYESLRASAARNPDKPAIYFFRDGAEYQTPVTITYRQFMARIHQFANLLRDLGVGHRDVASILLPNLPQTHFGIWGSEAQAVAGPINPLLEPSQIRDILLATRSQVLFTLGPVPGTDLWEKVERIRGEVPELKYVIRLQGPSDEKNGILGFDEVIDRYNPARLDSGRSFDPGELASIFHTGGTTGTPKLAPHTHFNEAFIFQVMKVLADLSEADTMICGLPLFHVNGVCVTGGAPFTAGSSVVLLTPQGYRNANAMKNFFRIVEHYKATFFSAVPTVMSTLLQIPMEGADVSSLRYAFCGAAPLATETFQAFEKHTGMKILEGYGLTEGTVVSAINPRDGERRIGTVGFRLPYQPLKTVILDEEGRYLRDAAVNEIGVVAIQGPNVFPGYLQEVHNRNLWVQEGWLNTGDLGRLDERGYLHLTGRKKDLIIRGGHNIDPALIEEPLAAMPGVSLVAAVPKPDKHAGEVPVAYVTLAPGASLTEEQILEHAKAHVGERAAIPKAIYILHTMPVTAVGKIFKPDLRRDAIRRAFEEELSSLGSAATVELQVLADDLHGTLAHVSLKPGPGVEPEELRNRVEALLRLYTVKYRIHLKS